MTLQDITDDVRKLLADDEYDESLIQMAANYFVYELFNEHRTRLMETTETLSAGAGDTFVEFPSDLIAWITIYVTEPKVYDITAKRQEYGDFMKDHANFATSSPANVLEWTQYGNTIRFAAPLLVDTTFTVDYLREPDAMEGLTSECEVPDRYRELVTRGTKVRLLEIDEDYDYANTERNNLDGLVTTFTRNEGRGGGKTGPTIMRTNRRRNGSEW